MRVFLSKTMLASLMFISISAPAMAGMYISAGVGQGNGSDWTPTPDPIQTFTKVKESNKDSAYSIAIGKMYGETLGMELGYTNLGKYTQSGTATTVDATVSSVNVDAVVALGSEGLKIVGKGGLAYTTNDIHSIAKDASVSKFKPHYGLGVEYQFIASMAAFSEYQVFETENSGGEAVKIKVANVGLRLHF